MEDKKSYPKGQGYGPPPIEVKKDHRINKSKYSAIFLICVSISFFIDGFVFNFPKWVWLTYIVLGILYLLAIYNPQKRINWIWNLKNKIFK